VTDLDQSETSTSWLLRCHDDMIDGKPVRNLDEAWEGLRHALATLENC
jgi:hypothetical protein